MKDRFEKALTEAFIVHLYSDTNPVQKKQGEWLGNCVFHNDKNPSFGFKTDPKDLGVYNCLSCAAQGNIYTYVREYLKETKPLIYLNEQLKIPIPEDNKFSKRFLRFKEKCENIDTNLKIPDKLILEKKKLLFGKFTKKLKILNDMGITDQIINDYNLGFDEHRFWIPIKDKYGIFRNVRKYDPNSKVKVISYAKGYGERRLWPIENLNSSTIYIMEGEKDTLIALSNGLNAITSTAGGSNWDSDWGELFKDKKVIICMDIDHSGVTGAQKRASNIKKYANEIKIIEFPLDIEEYPGGDFTDYIQKFSMHDFDLLVSKTKPLDLKIHKGSSEITVSFNDAFDCKYTGKKCCIKEVKLIGTEGINYQVPKVVFAKCLGTRKDKKCSSCSLKMDNSEINFEFQKYNPQLLEYLIINVRDKIVRLRESLGINRKCTENEIEILERQNVQVVSLRSGEHSEHEVDLNPYNIRRGIYVYEGPNPLKTNSIYTIKCLNTEDKVFQEMVHLIYEAEESENSLDNFKLTEDLEKQLKIFQVDYKKGESAQGKIDEIYQEFTSISQIYERNDVFAIMDLSFLSVLNYKTQAGLIEKGWIETCVLGDGSTGKTEICKFFLKHYRCGEMISAESLTLSGILAGVTQNKGGGWILEWGAIPQNDKGLLIIEETSGLKTEHINDLSHVRSGLAKITKVVKQTAYSRTRLIWVSNPRIPVCIEDCPYPVKLIFDLFGRHEDVRRLDAAIILCNSDVNLDEQDPVTTPFLPKYSSELCSKLVKFAWSLKPNGINISHDVNIYIRKQSKILVNKYSDRIPLVTSSEGQKKITRGSIAISIRLFSLNNDKKIEVLKEHVIIYINLINRIYESERMGYKDYSDYQIKIDKLNNVEEVCDDLHFDDEENIDELSGLYKISPEELKIFLSGGASERNELPKIIKRLKRNNALRQGSGNYYVFCKGLTRLMTSLKHWYKTGDLESYLNTHIRVNEKETVNLD